MSTPLTIEMIDELLELSLDEMDVVAAGRNRESLEKIARSGEQETK